ncbi:hypothetical protein CXB51_003905 [Gossypium anomalum]|uniref:Uncharacterized protein n=1 Tax=Gossypium anomalum TaxID=47600 RepID=A0A8J5ZM28_9ROSI|nr:hypothetical protein CXB51_003905 [Gossypium anomalum]
MLLRRCMKPVNKVRTNEHHLWEKRDSAGSGQKARNLVRITIYKALDKWVAWETEFPLIVVAKALRILRKRSQWLRVIQVKLDFMKSPILKVDEVGLLWNMVLHTHNRSISKRLFSRMISLFDHHSMPNKIIEVCQSPSRMPYKTNSDVFADMEELCVRLDETTVRKKTSRSWFLEDTWENENTSTLMANRLE